MACECGCGKMVKFGWGGKLNRFVNGHNAVGKQHALGSKRTEESKRIHSEFMIGNRYAVGCRYTRTKEWKKNQSEFMFGRKHGLGSKHTDEWKRDNSERNSGSRHPMWGKKHSEETVQKIRESQKRLWADPIYHENQRRRMIGGMDIRPTKPEIKVLSLLDCIYSHEGRYTGDGSFIVGGKNPDFVLNVNGEDLLIEVFGDWWHRDEDPQIRINFFAKFGYRTLVIWEHELKNISRVVGRIRRFVEGRN